MILELISMFLIFVGLLFFFGASVGILRFPDFYTRMHAAGKGDSLSSLLILAGFALHHFNGHLEAGWPQYLVAIKILMIGVLIMMTSPTSTHALMEAGYDDGIEPWKKEQQNGEGDKKE